MASESYICCLKYHVKVFDEIVSKVIFVILANIFRVMFGFDSTFALEIPKKLSQVP